MRHRVACCLSKRVPSGKNFPRSFRARKRHIHILTLSKLQRHRSSNYCGSERNTCPFIVTPIVHISSGNLIYLRLTGLYDMIGLHCEDDFFNDRNEKNVYGRLIDGSVYL